ncbi:MAG: hypothetical protein AABW49_01675 [Nanoarchaeota archaeon]
MVQKRQTAFHVWISMLHNGKFVKQLGEWEPSYIEYKGMVIGRVNIIASIVFKYSADDGTYVALTIDDGSASIRVKAWREDAQNIMKFNAGDLIQFIGRTREYNGEIYLSPEIIAHIDPNLELLRKNELIKKYGIIRLQEKQDTPQSNLAQKQPMIQVVTTNSTDMIEERIVTEKIIPSTNNSARQIILSTIEKTAGEDGALIESIIKQTGLQEVEVEAIVHELLKEGEIYQHKPGRINIM